MLLLDVIFLENHPLFKGQHCVTMFTDSPLHQFMHTCVLGQQVIRFQPQREEVTVFGGEQAKQIGVTTQVIGWRHC